MDFALASRLRTAGLLLTALWLSPQLASAAEASRPASESSKAPPLSPQESIATMRIQPGYRVIPVLTEPQIHEPAAIAWDGNGRMYVVEMRTYMQDIDGNDQLTPTSRVSRHEDTNGDGVYDKHTVFADNLVLPRMVLPLLDRVIIRETNTLDLKSYQDTNGDGVADKIELWHEGGPRGGNLEHQPSGLIWNIDNWLYTTYSAHRYRVKAGKIIREPMPHGSGQWGLTHDNEGRIFYSTAGGENPAMDFQRPIIYGKLSLPGEQAPDFREVFPIDDVPDVQGGRGRVRADNSLNKFTGCGGQSIFRGDAMPDDWQGDLIIPEPVGRLIRRAKVTNDAGKIIVSNAYPGAEFIAASDPNFRPINSATGPDGCLYLVDMYRGIIQEGNWVREGSYLRGVVQEYELDKNIGRGRIYRVEHESSQRGPQPRMLEETPIELIRHLAHRNGWWRSEAQKLIILHGDKRVVPELEAMATTHNNALARLHALWTLEGLDAANASLLQQCFDDPDSRIRSAALRLAEPLLAEGGSLDQSINQLAADPNPDVVIQVLLSATRSGHQSAGELLGKTVRARPANDPVRQIAEQVQRQLAELEAERIKLEEMKRRNRLLAESVVRGKQTYTTLCITCHGADGKGQPSPDKPGVVLAPALDGSERVTGHKERLIRVLLHGLIGSIEGKTYPDGLMLPMGANSDAWIADVTTYIRNDWNNRASLVEPSDVARIRSASEGRMGPWTLKELAFYDPPALEDRERWKLSASHNAQKVRSAIDGRSESRWDTGKTQQPGMWFQIELPEPINVMSLSLDTRGSSQDYPRGFLVNVSADGKQWGKPVAKGTGDGPITDIEIDSPDPVRLIRISQTGNSPSKYWSIHDLKIKGRSLREKPPVPLGQQLAGEDAVELAREAREHGDARRGAALFFNPALSCVKCHASEGEARLGPDLASRRDGVSDVFLVDAVLHPSKDIREAYAQRMVLTESGLMVTGFPVSEDDDTLVIREPAGGREISLDQEEVLAVKDATVSAMPAGLINQLESREQFLDLIRFLMEINGKGIQTVNSLRK